MKVNTVNAAELQSKIHAKAIKLSRGQFVLESDNMSKIVAKPLAAGVKAAKLRREVERINSGVRILREG